MRKSFINIPILLTLLCVLSGCSSVGDKTGSLSIVYVATALLSLILLIGCHFSVRQKRGWFLLLFSSVFIVNTGYTLLAVSTNLEMALMANRVSYLGSVFLPFSMLMIILNVLAVPYSKKLPCLLFVLAILIFLIAASPGILDIYYKTVSFEVVNGVSALVKEYGPLHSIYLFYLTGYFIAMITFILRSRTKETLDSSIHAVILAIAVFVNIGVWLIEQLVHIDFEMLSVSYIISELFLLSTHLAMVENTRLRETVKQVSLVQSYSEETKAAPTTVLEYQSPANEIASERVEAFIAGLQQLTPTEKEIYEAYISRITTKEILETRNIKESTLKYHNRNLYGKLGISSRKELLEIHKYIKSIEENL